MGVIQYQCTVAAALIILASASSCPAAFEIKKCHAIVPESTCRRHKGTFVRGTKECIVDPIVDNPATDDPVSGPTPESTTPGLPTSAFTEKPKPEPKPIPKSCLKGLKYNPKTGKCHGKIPKSDCVKNGGIFSLRNQECTMKPKPRPRPTPQPPVESKSCLKGFTLNPKTGLCHRKTTKAECKKYGGVFVKNRECRLKPTIVTIYCGKNFIYHPETGKCHGNVPETTCLLYEGQYIRKTKECILDPNAPTSDAPPEPTVYCDPGFIYHPETGKCHGKVSVKTCKSYGGQYKNKVCLIDPISVTSTTEIPTTTDDDIPEMKYCQKGFTYHPRDGKCHGKVPRKTCQLYDGTFKNRECLVDPSDEPITTPIPKPRRRCPPKFTFNKSIRMCTLTPSTEEACRKLKGKKFDLNKKTCFVRPSGNPSDDDDDFDDPTEDPADPLIELPDPDTITTVTFVTKEPKILLCPAGFSGNPRTSRCEKRTSASTCAERKGRYISSSKICIVPSFVPRVPICRSDLDYNNKIRFCGLNYPEEECKERGYAYLHNRCIYVPIKKFTVCPAGSKLVTYDDNKQKLNICSITNAKECKKRGLRLDLVTKQCSTYAEPCPTGYQYDNGYESCRKKNVDKRSCKQSGGVFAKDSCFVRPHVA